MRVASYWRAAKLGMGVGRGQGVVLFPIQEITTKAGGTMEAARLSLRDNFLLPSDFPNSMNQNSYPSSQTPVKIVLAPACLEWMVVCG